MSIDTIQQLLRAGWGYVLVAKRESIPWVFPETLPLRVDSTDPVGVPEGFDGACPALYFGEDFAFTQETDRETGFARGDERNLMLAWEPLEDYDLLTKFFRTASKRVRLTADVAADDTVLALEDTDGWQVDDYGWIGRELVRVVDVVDSTHLEVERAVLGYAYAYRADSPSTFSWLTDRPMIWLGCYWTVYLHVLSPEGRMLDAVWTEGEFCIEVDRLFGDKAWKPTRLGMQLRTLPLPRLCAKPLGYEVGLEVAVPENLGAFPIVVGPQASIRIQGFFSGPSSGDFDFRIPADGEFATDTPTVVRTWCAEAQAELDDQLSAFTWYAPGSAYVSVNESNLAEGTGNGNLPQGQLAVRFEYDNSFDVYDVFMTVAVERTPWLTTQSAAQISTMEAFYSNEGGGFRRVSWDPFAWPLVAPRFNVNDWIGVYQVSGEGYQDLEVPEAGVALVLEDESGGRELIRWDRKIDYPAPNSLGRGVTMLRIAERNVAGTPGVTITDAATWNLVSGTDGTPAEVLLKLLQSSGTGTRGDYDVLGLGLGLGIPEEFIDVDGILTAAPELGEIVINAYVDGKASLEDLIGGWLALSGFCLVQRRMDDGRLRLTLVRTEPGALVGGYSTIGRESAELDAIDDPDTIDEAFEVQVSLSGPASGDVPDVIVRDVPAIQAGAAREASFSVPGLTPTRATQFGAERIANGLGQGIAAIPIAPWLLLQCGDLVVDELRHPGSYDPATGTRAPERIAGRVIAERWSPVDGRRAVVTLRAGILGTGFYFCPGCEVTAKTSTTITVDTDLTVLFSPDGDPITVRLYNPGRETTDSAEFACTINGTNELELVSGTFPSWVDAYDAPTEVTFADIGNGNHPDAEPSYLFQVTERSYT